MAVEQIISHALDQGFVAMRGTSQQLWLHQVPKEPKVTEPRINLTFRQILGR